MKMKVFLLAVLLMLLTLVPATAQVPVAMLLGRFATVTQQQPVVLCPACKIIIDHSSLQAAAAGMQLSAYGAWEATLQLYESGAITWQEAKAMSDETCEWAEKIRQWQEQMEKRIRDISLRTKK